MYIKLIVGVIKEAKIGVVAAILGCLDQVIDRVDVDKSAVCVVALVVYWRSTQRINTLWTDLTTGIPTRETAKHGIR